jgi:hypothetical protein
VSSKFDRIKGLKCDTVIVDDPITVKLKFPTNPMPDLDILKAWANVTRHMPTKQIASRAKRKANDMPPKGKHHAVSRHKRKMEMLNTAERFFHRKMFIFLGGVDFECSYYNSYGQAQFTSAVELMIVGRTENVRIAKIVDGDLWIRHNHADTSDTDTREWKKARNSTPERLNLEILQIGKYLENGEIDQTEAEELLDLMYAHLGRALR